MGNNINTTKMFYVPLELENQHLAVDGEIMIDYDKAMIYVRDNNRTIQLGAYEIDKSLQEVIEELLDGASLRGNNLFKLENRLNNLLDWKERNMSTDMDLVVNTFLELIEKFRGFPAEASTLKSIINNKVLKVEGKTLSSNNFTVEEYNKLQNIQTLANNYVHPATKVCRYHDPVESVNGKTGALTLTKDDIGLENLDINANDYTHPKIKVCNTPIVTSVNNKIGEVIITREDVDLNNLENFSMKGLDIYKPDENSYFTTKNISTIINTYADSIINKYEIINREYILENKITPKNILDQLASLHYIYRNPNTLEETRNDIYQTDNINEIMYVNPLTMNDNIKWTEFNIGKQRCFLANDIILHRCIPRVFISQLFALNHYIIDGEFYILTVPDRNIQRLFNLDIDHFINKSAYNILLQDITNPRVFTDHTIMGMDMNANIKQGSFYKKIDTVFLSWRPILKQMTWKR